MNTEDEIDTIVRARLKPIREAHKARVQKLLDKIEILETRLDRASRAEDHVLERATWGTGEMGQ